MKLFLKSITFLGLFLSFTRIESAKSTFPCIVTSTHETPPFSGDLNASNNFFYSFQYYPHKDASPQTTTGTEINLEAVNQQFDNLKRRYQNPPRCIKLGGKIIGSTSR